MECPQIKFSEFKKLTSSKVRDMKSVEVVSDGETLFFAIIPPRNGGMSITDNIKTTADYLGARGNTVGGKMPEELIDAPVLV
jgi:hypothetical protein